ncbi:MBL fold metallo-hydrolase [Virgisporangium ochraceum]|uniref:MBL fold metallo-hydrolase n=1 Tax=Virgisporangium ochraceum TaxID=65505 RepID=A0A8J4A512_9ACTN|nr:MBL fold metallo-hydrolase [Virgisporangium ochraceum]GIJ75241.1 MBL fold metallo-hydrolase [Virgisporangium ochraceum]
MRIHHLNCGTMRPIGGRLISGGGPARLVAHCLLIEADGGLVLVDTGFGLSALADPVAAVGGMFVRTARPVLDAAEAAVTQVRTLGYDPADVRHVLVTHLDPDHAGGLPDFPDAEVHVHVAEHRAALARRGMADRNRYRPSLWDHELRWSLHDVDGGEDWFGFPSVRPLDESWPPIRLVRLAGHTAGHVGVAVPTDAGTWLLHAGDAYFHRVTIDGTARPPLGIRLEEASTQTDRAARLTTVAKLRAARQAGIEVFCSHDPVEYERQASTRVEPPPTD